ncbi:MAG: zinc ribbon domain-containing protein, partial [Planctomycetota bacterium]
MPLYEYNCQACQQPIEILVRGDEQPTCPTCGSVKLERLLSVPAAHVSSGSELPMAPPPGGCGAPQCG